MACFSADSDNPTITTNATNLTDVFEGHTVEISGDQFVVFGNLDP